MMLSLEQEQFLDDKVDGSDAKTTLLGERGGMGWEGCCPHFKLGLLEPGYRHRRHTPSWGLIRLIG